MPFKISSILIGGALKGNNRSPFSGVVSSTLKLTPGLKLRVRKENLIFLFLNQNSMRRFFCAPNTCIKTDGYENIFIFMMKKKC